MRNFTVTVVLVAVVAAGFFLLAGNPRKGSGDLVVELKGDGRAQLAVGRELVVKMDENPTTGYIWEFAISPEGILAPAGADYTRDEAPAGMVGVGGTRTFRFKAVSGGEAIIMFSESRPWEEGVPPVRVYKLDVSAR